MGDGNRSGRIRSLHSIGETYMNLRKAHACLLLRYLGDFAMPAGQQTTGRRLAAAAGVISPASVISINVRHSRCPLLGVPCKGQPLETLPHPHQGQ